MHHGRHSQIHAMGAAIVEQVRDAMREEGAGSGTDARLIINMHDRESFARP